MATVAELVVSGYIRELQRELCIHIPTDIWIVFIMFYPNYIQFDGNTMNLTLKEKEIITSWFIKIFSLENKSSILTSTLLYDCNKHGKTGKAFHSKCDQNINTFTIVESEFNGHIFGCFLSKKLNKFEEHDLGKWISDDKVFYV